MAIPKFFAPNDRPVKVIEGDGGWEAFALDMSTGDWVPAPDYLDRYWRRDGDLDLYTEDEFNARVAEVRKSIGKVMPEERDLPKRVRRDSHLSSKRRWSSRSSCIVIKSARGLKSLTSPIFLGFRAWFWNTAAMKIWPSQGCFMTQSKTKAGSRQRTPLQRRATGCREREGLWRTSEEFKVT